MEKIKGLIWINFKEGVTEEQVQECVNKIYLDNKEVMSGMEYDEFKNEKAFKEMRKKYDEFAKE